MCVCVCVHVVYTLYIVLREMEGANAARSEKTTFRPSSRYPVTRPPFGYIQLDRVGAVAQTTDPMASEDPEPECTSSWNETGEVAFRV